MTFQDDETSADRVFTTVDVGDDLVVNDDVSILLLVFASAALAELTEK